MRISLSSVPLGLPLWASLHCFESLLIQQLGYIPFPSSFPSCFDVKCWRPTGPCEFPPPPDGRSVDTIAHEHAAISQQKGNLVVAEPVIRYSATANARASSSYMAHTRTGRGDALGRDRGLRRLPRNLPGKQAANLLGKSGFTKRTSTNPVPIRFLSQPTALKYRRCLREPRPVR